MKAAVVHSFDQPPSYADFPDPVPQADEVMVTLHAAALSQLVRAQASGKHYSSKTALPLVPGVDGVGRLADGSRVYVAMPRGSGTMAERTAVKAAYCIPLPDGLDDVTAAAAANPGMSSWAALVERAKLQRGESVSIIGATGAAGKLAIQIARHLGAGRIIATGRRASSEAELRSLGADAFLATEQSPQDLTEAFGKEIAQGVDVVLDYLYGPSAECFIAAAAGHGRGKAEPRIRYVNIGSLGGATITLPAAGLRSSGIELLGSGLGSVSNEALIRCIAGVMNAFIPGKFSIAADPTPLAQVESAWLAKDTGRIVFTM